MAGFQDGFLLANKHSRWGWDAASLTIYSVFLLFGMTDRYQTKRRNFPFGSWCQSEFDIQVYIGIHVYLLEILKIFTRFQDCVFLGLCIVRTQMSLEFGEEQGPALETLDWISGG